MAIERHSDFSKRCLVVDPPRIHCRLHVLAASYDDHNWDLGITKAVMEQIVVFAQDFGGSIIGFDDINKQADASSVR